MGWLKRTFCRKSSLVSTELSIEDVRHEIRNAMLGIKFEKKKLSNALGDQAKALIGIRMHMERIDRALKPQNGAEGLRGVAE